MSKVKLSIIIPYYKTYDLTRKLLDSLIPQLNDRVEIIFINDGCPQDDFSMYASDNVRIYTQENQGVAKTRNFGIEASQGKYIGFIDSDDMVTSDYVDVLLDAIDKFDGIDIINFNWVDLYYNIVYRKPSNYAVWKAIYNRKTIPRFREDREYGEEDIDFQEELMTSRKRFYSIIYLDRVLYLYNSNREGSLYWKAQHKGEMVE